MYEAANVIFTVGLTLFHGYCLQYFYGSFLEGRIPDRRWNGLAAAAFYVAFRLAFALCFYRAFCPVTAFLMTAFQAVVDISRYTVAILWSETGEWFLDLWNWCMGRGIISSARTFGILVNTGLFLEWFLEYLAIALLSWWGLRKMVRDFREKEYVMNRTELFFILIPAAVGLMLCVMLRVIIVIVEEGVPELLYDRYPVLTAVIPAILLLSLLSVLQGVKLFQDMICRNREKSERIVLEKQAAGLQEQMEGMERRKMRSCKIIWRS